MQILFKENERSEAKEGSETSFRDARCGHLKCCFDPEKDGQVKTPHCGR